MGLFDSIIGSEKQATPAEQLLAGAIGNAGQVANATAAPYFQEAAARALQPSQLARESNQFNQSLDQRNQLFGQEIVNKEKAVLAQKDLMDRIDQFDTTDSGMEFASRVADMIGTAKGDTVYSKFAKDWREINKVTDPAEREKLKAIMRERRMALPSKNEMMQLAGLGVKKGEDHSSELSRNYQKDWNDDVQKLTEATRASVMRPFIAEMEGKTATGVNKALMDIGQPVWGLVSKGLAKAQETIVAKIPEKETAKRYSAMRDVASKLEQVPIAFTSEMRDPNFGHRYAQAGIQAWKTWYAGQMKYDMDLVTKTKVGDKLSTQDQDKIRDAVRRATGQWDITYPAAAEMLKNKSVDMAKVKIAAIDNLNEWIAQDKKTGEVTRSIREKAGEAFMVSMSKNPILRGAMPWITSEDFRPFIGAALPLISHEIDNNPTIRADIEAAPTQVSKDVTKAAKSK